MVPTEAGPHPFPLLEALSLPPLVSPRLQSALCSSPVPISSRLVPRSGCVSLAFAGPAIHPAFHRLFVASPWTRIVAGSTWMSWHLRTAWAHNPFTESASFHLSQMFRRFGLWSSAPSVHFSFCASCFKIRRFILIISSVPPPQTRHIAPGFRGLYPGLRVRDWHDGESPCAMGPA